MNNNISSSTSSPLLPDDNITHKMRAEEQTTNQTAPSKINSTKEARLATVKEVAKNAITSTSTRVVFKREAMAGLNISKDQEKADITKIKNQSPYKRSDAIPSSFTAQQAMAMVKESQVSQGLNFKLEQDKTREDCDNIVKRVGLTIDRRNTRRSDNINKILLSENILDLITAKKDELNEHTKKINNDKILSPDSKKQLIEGNMNLTKMLDKAASQLQKVLTSDFHLTAAEKDVLQELRNSLKEKLKNTLERL